MPGMTMCDYGDYGQVFAFLPTNISPAGSSYKTLRREMTYIAGLLALQSLYFLYPNLASILNLPSSGWQETDPSSLELNWVTLCSGLLMSWLRLVIPG